MKTPTPEQVEAALTFADEHQPTITIAAAVILAAEVRRLQSIACELQTINDECGYVSRSDYETMHNAIHGAGGYVELLAAKTQENLMLAHDAEVAEARAREWVNVAGLNGAAKDAAILAGRHWKERAEAADAQCLKVAHGLADQLDALKALVVEKDKALEYVSRVAHSYWPAEYSTTSAVHCTYVIEVADKARKLTPSGMTSRIAESEAQVKTYDRLRVESIEYAQKCEARIAALVKAGDAVGSQLRTFRESGMWNDLDQESLAAWEAAK